MAIWDKRQVSISGLAQVSRTVRELDVASRRAPYAFRFLLAHKVATKGFACARKVQEIDRMKVAEYLGRTKGTLEVSRQARGATSRRKTDLEEYIKGKYRQRNSAIHLTAFQYRPRVWFGNRIIFGPRSRCD